MEFEFIKKVYLQIMLKVVSSIFHWFVLLIVGAALVGVNIVQLYCLCCDESCLHVEFVPQEEAWSCGEHLHGEQDSCCLPAEKEFSRHDFYKVAGFSFDVKNVVPDIQFGGMVFFFSDCQPWPLDTVVCFVDIPDFVPDEPPSQESLCTYRC